MWLRPVWACRRICQASRVGWESTRPRRTLHRARVLHGAAVPTVANAVETDITTLQGDVATVRSDLSGVKSRLGKYANASTAANAVETDITTTPRRVNDPWLAHDAAR